MADILADPIIGTPLLESSLAKLGCPRVVSLESILFKDPLKINGMLSVIAIAEFLEVRVVYQRAMP